MTTEVQHHCMHHWVLTSSESTVGVCRSCGRRRGFGSQAPEANRAPAAKRSELLSRDALITLADTSVEEAAWLRSGNVGGWGLA